MISAPSRRWFRWSLRMLVAVITVAACIASWNPWSKAPDDWIPVAIVGSPETADATRELLAARGINAGIEGSVTYEVIVQRRDAPRACQLIRAEGTPLGPYLNSIADY